MSSERNSIADFLTRYKYPLATVKQDDILANDEEGLEYLKDSTKKQLGTKDLIPLTNEEQENLYKIPQRFKHAFITQRELRIRYNEQFGTNYILDSNDMLYCYIYLSVLWFMFNYNMTSLY